MSKESKFTPMPEAQTWRLNTTAELPFDLHKQVGLNVSRLQTLCQISGFQKLEIRNQKDPRTSKAAALVVGMNNKGEALAGKSGIDTVPNSTHISKPSPRDKGLYKSSRWHDLTIDLNTKEMQQRMLLSNQDVRQAKLWAKDINKALVQGIVRAGIKELVKVDAYDKLLMSLAYLLPTPTLLLINSDLFVATISTNTLIYNFFKGSLLDKPENFEKGEGHRWSLFIGPELDRAAVLMGLAHTQKLVKKIT